MADSESSVRVELEKLKDAVLHLTDRLSSVATMVKALSDEAIRRNQFVAGDITELNQGQRDFLKGCGDCKLGMAEKCSKIRGQCRKEIDAEQAAQRVELTRLATRTAYTTGLLVFIASVGSQVLIRVFF